MTAIAQIRSPYRPTLDLDPCAGTPRKNDPDVPPARSPRRVNNAVAENDSVVSGQRSLPRRTPTAVLQSSGANFAQAQPQRGAKEYNHGTT